MTALRAAGYLVYAINPLSAARYRERHSTSGAKSDAGDAHVLAEIVRLDREHHRPVAGDSDLADSVKLLARAHQTAVWERTRHMLRLRSALLEYFPAAVQAFEDLAGADSLSLLARAPDPRRAAKLTRSQLVAALRAARRHHVEARADALLAVLRAPALRQAPALEDAYAAIVAAQVAIITTLNEQITQLQKAVGEHFGRHPAADIYLSQPGLGVVLAARALGEFGDDKGRFGDARARKNYSGQSPITRASGKKSVVMARYATNRRLGAALHATGLRRADRVTRRPDLLRRAPRQKHRSPRRPSPTRESARRHPARLPQNRGPLRREHRLAIPANRHQDRRCLTNFSMGCLPALGRSERDRTCGIEQRVIVEDEMSSSPPRGDR